MAGIKNIKDLYKKVGEKGLREVLEKDVRVTEKFDAYRFAFEKNPHNYKIYFYGKNGKTPLSKIDRTVNDLYEAAIAHIENGKYPHVQMIHVSPNYTCVVDGKMFSL